MRALGADKDVQVDVAEHPLMPGDLVLLASDGLSKMVIDADVAAVIAAEVEPQKIVDVLSAKSRAAGGVDNIAIVAAKVPAVGGNTSVISLVSKLFGR